MRARYDYDPYGRMTKISGNKDTVFGFTGHLWHAQSGLNLAKYRAYDPNLGRWISRDPLGCIPEMISRFGVEAMQPETSPDGPNLYSYVVNNPVNGHDSLGLQTWDSVTNAFKRCMCMPPIGRFQCLKNLLDNIGDPSDPFFKPWYDALNNLANKIGNKLNHIFDNPGHNFDPLLNSFNGDQLAAASSLESAAANAYNAAGMNGIQNIPVTVNGINAIVRGGMVNGTFEVSTAYIK